MEATKMTRLEKMVLHHIRTLEPLPMLDLRGCYEAYLDGLVKFFWYHGALHHAEIMECLACHGDLDTIKELREDGCEFVRAAGLMAARCGNVDVVLYALEETDVFDSLDDVLYLKEWAVTNHQSDVVKYIDEFIDDRRSDAKNLAADAISKVLAADREKHERNKNQS
jgi:hypothetical protein